ncbi:MAG TPA: ABC transporter permease [Actinophytocola sp.]|uniref:ABC transporter permease n=1 Tax=Actinophytocola sp. TaxID=1872138 RepID=UPI002DB9F936|nr:ABC transporter permease [Actinophytocola sp.]HEU5472096.1 ABC transporter permease [Actinophytocola sp.]
MGKFIVRRLAQAVLVIIAAMLLLFLALFTLGDPFATSGDKAVPPETQAALRAKFGLDKPVPVQFLVYLKNMFTGDLGIDFDQRRPVAEMLAAALPYTLRLAAVAIVLDILIGVVSGVIAAVWRYSFADVLVTILTTLAIGVPTFVIGLTLRKYLSGELFFPAVPRSAFGPEPFWLAEVLLPAITLAIVDAAFIARLMRGSMLEVMRADYIRTARAKGLSERKVIGKHVMRNSIIPVVTYVGIGIGVLLGGALITETIFQYQGVGYLLYKAILSNNNPVIMAVCAFAVIVFVLLSLLVDILYAFLDPRIRLS